MRRKSFKDASSLWEEERGKVVKSTSMAAYSLIIRNQRLNLLIILLDKGKQILVLDAFNYIIHHITINSILLV